MNITTLMELKQNVRIINLKIPKNNLVQYFEDHKTDPRLKSHRSIRLSSFLLKSLEEILNGCSEKNLS